MEYLESGFIIIGMLVIVIFMGAAKKKTELIINFVLRMVVGTILIYFINYGLNFYGVRVSVAINPFNVLTSGFLGIPGLAVLYGIKFYKLL